MITFLVTNEEQTIRFECSLSDSIEIFKNNIKKDFNLGEKYIDIYEYDKVLRYDKKEYNIKDLEHMKEFIMFLKVRIKKI